MKDIIKENHYKIQQIIKKFIGNYNEDIEQEIYLKTLKNKDKYKEEGKFSQWLCMIAANFCKDYLKSSSFKNQMKTSENDETIEQIKYTKTPEKIYDSKLRQKIILKEINNLPKKLKETIILYEFENLSYDAISKKLNIAQGTVKSRINSARTILKAKLNFLLED